MAIELANEPHTSDGFESQCSGGTDFMGKKPGDLVHEWLSKLAREVRKIDAVHLLATGEEGYNSSGPKDRHGWLDNGLKGVDFSRNVRIKDISFATMHVYPDNWGISASEMNWVMENVVKDRAKIAHQAQKPIVMEEYGFGPGYGPREILLRQIHSAANEAGVAGLMPWILVPTGVEQDSYMVDYDDPEFKAISDQVQCLRQRNEGKVLSADGGCVGYVPPAGGTIDPSARDKKCWHTGGGWGWRPIPGESCSDIEKSCAGGPSWCVEPPQAQTSDPNTKCWHTGDGWGWRPIPGESCSDIEKSCAGGPSWCIEPTGTKNV
jgi:mannan endo-1,4-beta-mannosidase